MSDWQFKVCFRIYDENINSREELLKVMREVYDSEPTWIEGEDPDDDMELLYGYRRLDENGSPKNHTLKDTPYFAAVEDDGIFGIELVLLHTRGSMPVVSMNHSRFMRHLGEVSGKLGIDAEHERLLFYSWWDGGDEPIEW